MELSIGTYSDEFEYPYEDYDHYPIPTIVNMEDIFIKGKADDENLFFFESIQKEEIESENELSSYCFSSYSPLQYNEKNATTINPLMIYYTQKTEIESEEIELISSSSLSSSPSSSPVSSPLPLPLPSTPEPLTQEINESIEIYSETPIFTPEKNNNKIRKRKNNEISEENQNNDNKNINKTDLERAILKRFKTNRVERRSVPIVIDKIVGGKISDRLSRIESLMEDDSIPKVAVLWIHKTRAFQRCQTDFEEYKKQMEGFDLRDDIIKYEMCPIAHTLHARNVYELIGRRSDIIKFCHHNRRLGPTIMYTPLKTLIDNHQYTEIPLEIINEINDMIIFRKNAYIPYTRNNKITFIEGPTPSSTPVMIYDQARINWLRLCFIYLYFFRHAIKDNSITVTLCPEDPSNLHINFSTHLLHLVSIHHFLFFKIKNHYKTDVYPVKRCPHSELENSFCVCTSLY